MDAHGSDGPGAATIATLDELERFATATEPQNRVLTEPLKGVLAETALTGRNRYPFQLVKPLLELLLEQTLRQYEQAQAADGEGPARPVIGDESLPEALSRFRTLLHGFTKAPWTIQRLCEVLLNPTRQYRKLHKLALAIEKCLMVTGEVGVTPRLPPPPLLSTLQHVNDNSKCHDPQPVTSGTAGGLQHPLLRHHNNHNSGSPRLPLILPLLTLAPFNPGLACSFWDRRWPFCTTTTTLILDCPDSFVFTHSWLHPTLVLPAASGTAGGTQHPFPHHHNHHHPFGSHGADAQEDADMFSSVAERAAAAAAAAVVAEGMEIETPTGASVMGGQPHQQAHQQHQQGGETAGRDDAGTAAAAAEAAAQAVVGGFDRGGDAAGGRDGADQGEGAPHATTAHDAAAAEGSPKGAPARSTQQGLEGGAPASAGSPGAAASGGEQERGEGCERVPATPPLNASGREEAREGQEVGQQQ
ncbi:PPP4R2-domain-containing protein [Dunaliella salina]|uniref:PPP4R2-domain-containing protein n=1 Tax=Dunaliella salina TaxID=3046 RepID=A0ABQ7G0K5_DUNSA|nr:PPP4R2-domain-containing protein [Dunaliella salina]|eukprot:KAF5828134.1 PPP4R2-domain-containing protein [Dunaliella salina]